MPEPQESPSVGFSRSLKDQEKIPFIADEGNSEDQEARSNGSGLLLNKPTRLNQLLLALQLILFFLNASLLILNVPSLACRDHNRTDNIAFEKAFSTLLRITMEEIKRMNKTSLALINRSGYVGYLESFHMLHCLVRDHPRLVKSISIHRKQKRIYQAHHPAHYPKQQRDGAFTASHLYVTINTSFWETPTKVQGAKPGETLILTFIFIPI
ncbi:hypothetical protein F4779DRAFT_632536 [Xylariaceae sp. FL0662B]|nr:hypothetical protein F4779DRAFT_632536 [Xylariaceae sp. FL0662B]